MQSVICSFFINLIHRLAIWFDESLLGRIFYAIFGFVKRTAQSSVPGKYCLNGKSAREAFSKSLFGRFLLLFLKPVRAIARKTGDFSRAASEGSAAVHLLKSWYLVSSKAYGVFIFSYIFIYGMVSFARGALTLRALAAYLILIAVSVLMIIINRSPKALFKGSAFLKWVGGIFYETKSPEKSRLFSKEDYLKTNGVFIAAVCGTAFALLSLIFSPLSVVLAAAGTLGLVLILKFTALGVFITASAAPLLPTMVLAALSILCGLSLLLRLLTDKDYKLTFSPVFTAILVFALAYFLGTLTSFDVLSSVKIMMIHFSFIMFCFVAVCVMRDDKTRKVIITGILTVAAFVSIYGIAQHFLGITGADSWVDSNMFQDIKTRVFSTFDNPNVLGEYLVLIIPMTLAFFMRTEKPGYKLSFLVMLALAAGCLIFTWSRGAWLGAIIAVCLCLCVSDKRWLLCGLVLVAAIPFLPMALGSDSAVITRITSIGDMADSSTAYRVSIWRAAVDIIKDFWIGGVGPGSDAFSVVYPRYALSGASFALHSHNLFLQIMVEIGIGGFLAFIYLIIRLGKTGVSALNKTKNAKTLNNSIVICGIAGLLGLLAQGLTDYIWYNYKMVLIFWVFIAIVCSAAEGSMKEGAH